MVQSKRPVALVTGSSAGIGEWFARKLAASGHDLVLVARRADRLEKLAAELKQKHGAAALVVASDLGRIEAPGELFAKVKDDGLHVDLLVNNAGYGTYGYFQDQDHAKELGQIDLNVRALVALTHLFLPAMLERKAGAVINLGSVGSFLSCPYMATYAATKAFILNFTEALSSELSGTGVHAMCVCPGGTWTEFQDVAGMNVKGMEVAFMTAEQVVDIALADLGRRKTISISGCLNKLNVLAMSLIPRRLLTPLVKLGFGGRNAATRK